MEERPSSLTMPSCPPPPPPPSLRRLSLDHLIDVERRSSHTTTMVDDINGRCEEELVGFILVAPLGSNTFVQRSCSNKEKNNLQVSVSSKKVLRPRPVSPSFD
jgi:hypothetical protein